MEKTNQKTLFNYEGQAAPKKLSRDKKPQEKPNKNKFLFEQTIKEVKKLIQTFPFEIKNIKPLTNTILFTFKHKPEEGPLDHSEIKNLIKKVDSFETILGRKINFVGSQTQYFSKNGFTIRYYLEPRFRVLASPSITESYFRMCKEAKDLLLRLPAPSRTWFVLDRHGYYPYNTYANTQYPPEEGIWIPTEEELNGMLLHALKVDAETMKQRYSEWKEHTKKFPFSASEKHYYLKYLMEVAYDMVWQNPAKKYTKKPLTYRVNDYLELRLDRDDGKTYIYVGGYSVLTCVYLFLNIRKDQLKKTQTIDSIDEAADRLKANTHFGEGFEDALTPKEEFRGHCSNIQAWYENDYDTRILHRTIAFTLLKKLSDAGDPLAKRKLKEEVVKRLESRYPTVITYLSKTDYLKLFSPEELGLLFDNIPEIFTELFIDKEGKYKVFPKKKEDLKFYSEIAPHVKNEKMKEHFSQMELAFKLHHTKDSLYKREHEKLKSYLKNVIGKKAYLDIDMRKLLYPIDWQIKEDEQNE